MFQGNPLHHERVQLLRLCPELTPIDPQANITGRKSHPLIAVHKGMNDKQAFQQGARLLHYFGIVARLRTEHGSLYSSNWLRHCERIKELQHIHVLYILDFLYNLRTC